MHDPDISTHAGRMRRGWKFERDLCLSLYLWAATFQPQVSAIPASCCATTAAMTLTVAATCRKLCFRYAGARRQALQCHRADPPQLAGAKVHGHPERDRAPCRPITCTTRVSTVSCVDAYTISGTITNASGSSTGLVLQNNGGDNLSGPRRRASAQTFTFSTPLGQLVPITSRCSLSPHNPNQTCTRVQQPAYCS